MRRLKKGFGVAGISLVAAASLSVLAEPQAGANISGTATDARPIDDAMHGRLVSAVHQAEVQVPGVSAAQMNLSSGVIEVWALPSAARTEAMAAMQKDYPELALVVHDAVHSQAEVDAARVTLLRAMPSWYTRDGISIHQIIPTRDGRFDLVTFPGSDIAVAERSASEALGPDWIHDVTQATSLAQMTSFRYDDSTPWNGGDGISIGNSNNANDRAWCSSGIPVNRDSDGRTFLLTAAHCWEGHEDTAEVRNGYVNDANEDGQWARNGSNALIGYLHDRDQRPDEVTNFNTTMDTALINARSSTLDFNAAWDSGGKAYQTNGETNALGDEVCTSGMYEGQRCNIIVDQTQVTNCYGGGGNECVFPLWRGDRGANNVAVGSGDSGGPVYRYSGANIVPKGMIEGGSTELHCPTTAPLFRWLQGGTMTYRTCGRYVYFIGISQVNGNWAVHVNHI